MGLLGEGGIVQQQVASPQQYVVEVVQAPPAEERLVGGEELDYPFGGDRRRPTGRNGRVWVFEG